MSSPRKSRSLKQSQRMAIAFELYRHGAGVGEIAKLPFMPTRTAIYNAIQKDDWESEKKRFQEQQLALLCKDKDLLSCYEGFRQRLSGFADRLEAVIDKGLQRVEENLNTDGLEITDYAIPYINRVAESLKLLGEIRKSTLIPPNLILQLATGETGEPPDLNVNFFYNEHPPVKTLEAQNESESET